MTLHSAAIALLFASTACFAATSDPVRSLTAQDLAGKTHQITTQGRVTVVVFLSSVCPISNDYNDRLSALYREYVPKGVQFLFVNSNSNESARDILQHAKAAEYPFAVHQDPGNHVADVLGATVTPEVFILDREGMVRYKGQIDDARNPARVQVHGVKAAVEDLLAGREVARKETKAFGCTIKRVKKAS
ncbi:MAG: redoxin domain-containing protein [Bryobacterales bacterium]|nr:redoxin domain-containing protein [Bryobacterales bacterium]